MVTTEAGTEILLLGPKGPFQQERFPFFAECDKSTLIQKHSCPKTVFMKGD